MSFNNQYIVYILRLWLPALLSLVSAAPLAFFVKVTFSLACPLAVVGIFVLVCALAPFVSCLLVVFVPRVCCCVVGCLPVVCVIARNPGPLAWGGGPFRWVMAPSLWPRLHLFWGYGFHFPFPFTASPFGCKGHQFDCSFSIGLPIWPQRARKPDCYRVIHRGIACRVILRVRWVGARWKCWWGRNAFARWKCWWGRNAGPDGSAGPTVLGQQACVAPHRRTPCDASI